ncbi:MAG: HD domain-containing protein [Euryarchaeota archaeon]|nr:HD domain-containing protein [Euryarchaeota archaeon]
MSLDAFGTAGTTPGSTQPSAPLPESRLPTIRDSIHKSIPIEPFVSDLLDTPQMQRLRRIRQLGGVYLVYPGANHTRFEHALGAYALARRVTRSLGLDDEDARVVMAGALLHDVGHGPFSHTSEEILFDAGRRHEDLTVDLVQWSTIASVLDNHGIPVRRVVDAILGQGRHSGLVSGDLDVDRMDYLVRDAYYTGVTVSVDVSRIATGLHLEGDEIVLDERSLLAAEALLVTRFMMYPAVYLHHTCRAIERMVVQGLRGLIDTKRLRPEELERLDDARLVAAMRAGPPATAEMARRLEERDLYKRAAEGRLAVARDVDGLIAASRDPAVRTRFETRIAERAGVGPAEVLLDVPPPTIMKETGIRVLRRDGSLAPLSTVSSLIGSLSRATEDHWRFRVFSPRGLREKVGPAAAEELGVETARFDMLSGP